MDIGEQSADTLSVPVGFCPWIVYDLSIQSGEENVGFEGKCNIPIAGLTDPLPGRRGEPENEVDGGSVVTSDIHRFHDSTQTYLIVVTMNHLSSHCRLFSASNESTSCSHEDRITCWRRHC